MAAGAACPLMRFWLGSKTSDLKADYEDTSSSDDDSGDSGDGDGGSDSTDSEDERMTLMVQDLKSAQHQTLRKQLLTASLDQQVLFFTTGSEVQSVRIGYREHEHSTHVHAFVPLPPLLRQYLITADRTNGSEVNAVNTADATSEARAVVDVKTTTFVLFVPAHYQLNRLHQAAVLEWMDGSPTILSDCAFGLHKKRYTMSLGTFYVSCSAL
jgi:hypothetical protein